MRRMLAAHPDLLYLLAFGALSTLVVFPFSAMLPVFLTTMMPAGPRTAVWTGHAVAAYGVGMLIGTCALALQRADLADRAGLRAATLAFSEPSVR